MADDLRTRTIHLAATFPAGSAERQQILATLAPTAGISPFGQKYAGLLIQLVRDIDDLAHSQKKSRALDLLEDLREMIAKDPEFKEFPNKIFGADQLIDELREALTACQTATRQAEHVYDELNKWWGRHGPK